MEIIGGRLDLSRRGLTAVPDEVFEHADRIEVLDLGGNRLADLPSRMAELTAMRVLFVSGNPLPRLPPALGACPALTQIGARGCGLAELPGEALPQALRWLTLTDNALAQLPASLGECPALQKLMLAGNRLEALPASLAGAKNLELLRLSANRFAALPPFLAEMPRLAWLAFAGNPFEHPRAEAPAIPWGDLAIGALLGEGASGLTMHALRRSTGEAVAVKLFRGAMTSDGLPEAEMAACLAAGPHENLVAALGSVAGHPEGRHGLVMPLIPSHWRVLAGPPSLEGCSRDSYDPALRLPLAVATRIAGSIAAAGAHLHGRGLLHGDLYAHNTLWDGGAGEAVLSDFGAASFLGEEDGGLTRLDVLAWGILLGELLGCCREAVPPALRALEAACRSPTPSERPCLRDALDALATAA